MYLFQQGLRYDKIAEGLGVRGEYVKTSQQFKDALVRSYQLAVRDGQSTVLNCWNTQTYLSVFA
jgi:thiamine pyrophosphate-dependent acetolactate synthase large subunit-like protein